MLVEVCGDPLHSWRATGNTAAVNAPLAEYLQRDYRLIAGLGDAFRVRLADGFPEYHINNMAATNDNNIQLVVRRHRCLLCAGRHTTAHCTVPIDWTLPLFERAEIWASDVERVAVEVAIRAQLLSHRQSRGATNHVRRIVVVFVKSFRLL
jgi:hypothetical protein